MEELNAQAIGEEQLRKFMEVLEKYRAGKALTDSRIISSENWWKMRNSIEETKTTMIGFGKDFASSSGWLHNVIVSKHADAMEAYPMPNILPREEQDKPEAKILSSIIPVVLKYNDFEQTYCDANWAKMKFGTAVYKVFWDAQKLNGLGDIGIEEVNILNLYWEPGVKDIQKSRYFFHTELVDKDVIESTYPETKDKLKGKSFMSSKFLYDEKMDTTDKETVIDVYYHKGKVLHYCKFVGDIVLYATENDPNAAERGLYDHGMYPYHFDKLYPIEGSPCGYGYVDICKNPQTAIDIMNTAFVKNTMVNATPRYMERSDGAINIEEFCDLTKPVVHVTGTLDDMSIRQITSTPLDGVNLALLDRQIQELRETSGNTETSTGNVSSGVTAASAIAALQEASGKGSRDSTKSSYRVFTGIVTMCIELIRQFYDMPRQFRIVGAAGGEQFVSYSNEGIKPQHQGTDFGTDMGYRVPAFDINVTAEKQNVYTRVSQNELALQFFQLGFFNPQNVDPALATIEMMDFDGKEELMQKISRNGTLYDKLMQYSQLALTMAKESHPELVQGLAQDIMQMTGQSAAITGSEQELLQTDAIKGLGAKEDTRVSNARERTQQVTKPTGGRVTGAARDD